MRVEMSNGRSRRGGGRRGPPRYSRFEFYLARVEYLPEIFSLKNSRSFFFLLLTYVYLYLCSLFNGSHTLIFNAVLLLGAFRK